MKAFSTTAKKLLLLSNVLLVLGFILFSYTQVDLNLTLSTNSLYVQLQKMLTSVGYFNRPLSTTIYSILLVWSFIQYLLLLRLAFRSKLIFTEVITFVLISSALLFAYPAFSYDIFNYLFDARIVIKYGLDPHYFRALDFPSDPWIRFMHWTHRYYPYGAGWLLLSLPVVYLGLGKFVLTLLLFKVMTALFYLAACFFIYRIAQKVHAPTALFALVFFALNPLVLGEGLIAGHNELVMLTLSLWAMYLFMNAKQSSSIWMLFLSISIKYISAALVPLMLFWRGKVHGRFFEFAWGLWLGAALLLSTQREVYGWYFLPTIALAACTRNRLIYALTLAYSSALMLLYSTSFWYGEYTQAYWSTTYMLGVIGGVSMVFLSTLFVRFVLHVPTKEK